MEAKLSVGGGTDRRRGGWVGVVLLVLVVIGLLARLGFERAAPPRSAALADPTTGSSAPAQPRAQRSVPTTDTAAPAAVDRSDQADADAADPIPCPLPPSADRVQAAFVPFDERGLAILSVEHGSALVDAQVALLSSGGWLSTRSTAPVAVRFDLRDGRLVCVVEDPPQVAPTGWVTGLVEPCDD